MLKGEKKMFNEYSAKDPSRIFEEINNIIDLLYITQCRTTRNALLNRLRRLLAALVSAARPGAPYGAVIPAGNSIAMQTPYDPPALSGPAPTAPMQNISQAMDQRTFTAAQLAQYNGKGENPAYVAVNGVVYDVTDQPGWAAGSHFGLKSGLDQTSAYISCHTGQPMLERMEVVGRLVK
jgi:predicted heme/steroid binding protein